MWVRGNERTDKLTNAAHHLLRTQVWPPGSHHPYRDIDPLFEVINDPKSPPLTPPSVFNGFSRCHLTLLQMHTWSARTNAQLFEVGVTSFPFCPTRQMTEFIVHLLERSVRCSMILFCAIILVLVCASSSHLSDRECPLPLSDSACPNHFSSRDWPCW